MALLPFPALQKSNEVVAQVANALEQRLKNVGLEESKMQAILNDDELAKLYQDIEKMDSTRDEMRGIALFLTGPFLGLCKTKKHRVSRVVSACRTKSVMMQ